MVAQQLLQHTVLLVFVASQQLQLLHSQRITPAPIKQYMCHNSNVCEHVCIVKGEHAKPCATEHDGAAHDRLFVGCRCCCAETLKGLFYAKGAILRAAERCDLGTPAVADLTGPSILS
jgi:hypothetical protein